MFQARKEMEPKDEEERGLRSLVLAKTLLSESLRFMREFCAKVTDGSFGEDAEQVSVNLANSHAFSRALKEIAVTQVHLILSEQTITNEPWFAEFIGAVAYLIDKLVLAVPAQDILASLSLSQSRGVSSQVAESILKSSGMAACKQYWSMKEEISGYLEQSKEIRAKLLDYALSQDPSILNDYLFTIQLFED